MERGTRVIATVINDVIFDQRMIRICNTLQDAQYSVVLVGRRLDRRTNDSVRFETRRMRLLFKSGPFFYLFYNIRLFFILLFSKADIIHSVDLDTLFPGFLVSKIKGIPLVYDAHEYFTEVPELLGRGLKRKIWLALEKCLLPHLKYAMTVSSGIASEYSQLYGTSFELIRNMPEKTGEIVSGKRINEHKGPYLLYQGALNKGRGLEELLHAMQSSPIPLKIAGTGDLEEELRSLTKSLNLDSKVEFLGNLVPSELIPITQNAFAGINVSENLGKSYYHSLNNKFFDYIQSGLPAITNPFPEYIGLDKIYHCVIFADAERESLLNAINLLLDDNGLYEDLKNNCFLAREHWNWASEAERLLIYYAKIC